jgi:beta-glucosidase
MAEKYINKENTGTYNNFLWGVSTSAFQIEGYVQNDMTEWENAGKFRQNGLNPKYRNAVQHWKHWSTDFDLLKDLGVNSYRFSIDWARIEPQPGKFDESSIQQYGKMIDRLLQLGIKPMLTLHHFTHPVWFHDTCPWHLSSSIQYYTRFVETIMKSFGDKIQLYITFNEPLVWALAAYGDGKFPPGEKDITKMALVLKHMLQAHKEAYQIIKKYQSAAQIGIAHNFIIFQPERSWYLLDRGITFLINRFYNFVFLDAFQKNQLKIILPFIIRFQESLMLDDCIDFWGINYYYRMHLRSQLRLSKPMEFKFHNRSGEGLSDLGWENYSRGLWEILKWVKRANKPIYITENGLADSQDRHRTAYLKNHLSITEKAIKNGIPIKGYFHWSLLDNYEWLVGKEGKFGLYEVDYENNFERKIRKSGQYYSNYIRKNMQ